MDDANQNNGGNALIELQGFTKRFGPRAAINNLSLSIERDKITAIVGEVGSGKTTLLRCLSLLEQPTSGRLFFDGNEVFDTVTPLIAMRIQALRQEIEECTDSESRNMLTRELMEVIHSFKQQRQTERKIKKRNSAGLLNSLKMRIAMVQSYFNFIPALTVRENMVYTVVKEGMMKKKEADESAESILKEFRFLDRANIYPNFLNELDTLCLSLLVALVRKPEVLVLDKPQGYSFEQLADFIEFVKGLMPKIKTLIFAAQDEAQAAKYAHNIIRL